MKLPFILTALTIASSASSVSAQEISIGVPVSLTGVYAFVGTAAVKGLQMAVDEINAGSEAGPGRTLKLVVADDGSNTNQTITLVNRLANIDKVMAIAGPSASPTVLAVSPVVNQLQIPMLGIAVTQAIKRYEPALMAIPAVSRNQRPQTGKSSSCRGNESVRRNHPTKHGTAGSSG